MNDYPPGMYKLTVETIDPAGKQSIACQTDLTLL
jgi:hypothetical protein